MGKYYNDAAKFAKQIVQTIIDAHKKGLAISVSIYCHGKNHNQRPQIDQDISNKGQTLHLNFHKAHQDQPNFLVTRMEDNRRLCVQCLGFHKDGPVLGFDNYGRCPGCQVEKIRKKW